MKDIPVEKNKKYIVDIIDNGFAGEGIAKIDNFTIFIKHAIKSEKCEILITKITASLAYAKLLKVLEPSKYRKELDCNTFEKCGGCDLRHIEYEETINIKRETVQNLVNKTLETKILVQNTKGMNNPNYYRNKAQFPVGVNEKGIISYGVFAPRSHRIIPNENCMIQTKISQKIANTIVKYIRDNNIQVYNEETLKGTIRHIVIRTSKKEKEVMCILVCNESINEEIKHELIHILINKFENIKTIIENINNQNTNVVMGEKNNIIYGDGFIEDKLGEYTFKISPNSFYQVNPTQVEVLYNEAIKGGNLTKKDVLFDLYCGIGTIGIFASKYVKEVYGIEIVEEAIKDAKENAKINNIDNIKFISGDVKDVFDRLINKEKIIPNVIIVDPPRKGLDDKTIENILQVKPDRLIYISCNPATQVRDLKKIEEYYSIESIQPVDMFPYTKHIECVSTLQRKDKLI